MFDFFSELARQTLDAFYQGNPIALFLLFMISGLTEIGMPFPFVLDTLLILAGYNMGIQQIFLMLLSLLLGREVGASIIYWLSRTAGKAFIKKISRRFPRVQDRMGWIGTRLSRRAPLAVAVARLTPGLLTPSTVCAGVMGVRYWHLVLGIALSSVIADCVLLGLGLGTKAGIKFLDLPEWVVLIALVAVIALAWGIQVAISRRMRRNKTVCDPNKLTKLGA